MRVAPILNGDLIIEPKGTLTLTNVTLLIKNKPEGMFQILAKSGSSLFIYNSNISPEQTESRFGFIVQEAQFILKQSKIDGIGQPAGENYGGGLIMDSTKGAVLDGNTIIHHEAYGLMLTNSEKIQITNNNISRIGPEETSGAIELNNSHGNTITHNHLFREYDAINLSSSWDNYVAYNEAELSQHTTGISIWYGSGNNTIAYNQISVLPDYDFACTAFRVVGVTQPNVIIDNTITGTKEAGLISYSSNIIIANNKVSGLTDTRPEMGSFDIYRSHDIQLLNNVVTSSQNGISLISSPNNQIKGNQIEGALYGVLLHQSDKNSIESNIFSKNNNNVVLDGSNSNEIMYNNFLHNQRQAYDDGTNQWAENYWGDYSGTDGGDGFGTVPYPIQETSADNKPKMGPYPSNSEPVPQLKPAMFINSPLQMESIRGNATWQNCNKEIKGWIIIESGATLTINNCVISVSPLKSGVENRIMIGQGASLAITNSTIKAIPSPKSWITQTRKQMPHIQRGIE